MADSDDWFFGTGDFTIEMQIRPSSLASASELLSHRSQADINNFWYVRLNTDGCVSVVAVNGGTTVTSVKTELPVTVGVWSHVAVVRSNGSVKIWIDGNNTDTVTTNSSSSWPNPSVLLYVGVAHDGLLNDYSGHMDEVRITKGIARYTTSFVPPNAEFPDFARASLLPAINNENIVSTQTEGANTTGWTTFSGGSVSASLGWLTVSGAAGAGAYVGGFTAASNDFVFYMRLRAPYVAGQGATVALRDSTGANRCAIGIGYSWLTSGNVLGNVGFTGGGTSFEIETGRNYSTEPLELAIHLDSDRSCINIFSKPSGSQEWKFAGSCAYASDIARFQMQINVGSSASSVECDYCICTRPAVIAFGDSVVAGHTLHDPSPAYYAGTDNNASTWMRNAKLFRSQRNTLIVNKGVGGNTSAQLYTRRTEVTDHLPKVVLLQASSNDHQAGVSQTDRTTTTQSIIDALSAAGAQVVLLNGIYANANYSAFPGHAGYMKTWWDSYRPGLTGLYGAIDTMVPLVDGGGVLDTALAQSDGIHPNLAGYAALGAYLEGI